MLSCPTGFVAKKSPARAPLPLGEVGATASGEGAGSSVSTRKRIPSPHPSPHGRGGRSARDAGSGGLSKRAPLPSPYRLRTADLRRLFRMTFERVVRCLDPGSFVAKKSPARAPLPLGEVGATASGEGAGPSVSTRNRIPSPQPSPHGRGGRSARVSGGGRSARVLGDFHERAPPCTPPYRLRTADLRRLFRMTFERVVRCLDPRASLRERSPARAPLPLGEVGATASGEGAGPSVSTRNRIPSPQPSPHGRGGRSARVAGSGGLSKRAPLPSPYRLRPADLRRLFRTTFERSVSCLDPGGFVAGKEPGPSTSPTGRGRRDSVG